MPGADLTFRGIPIRFDSECDKDRGHLIPFPAERESDVRRIVRKHRRKHPESKIRVVEFTNIGRSETHPSEE